MSEKEENIRVYTDLSNLIEADLEQYKNAQYARLQREQKDNNPIESTLERRAKEETQ